MEPNYYKENKRKSSEITRTKDVERGKLVNNIVTKAKRDNQTYVFTVGNRTNKGNIQDSYNVWLFDSGAFNHMILK